MARNTGNTVRGLVVAGTILGGLFGVTVPVAAQTYGGTSTTSTSSTTTSIDATTTTSIDATTTTVDATTTTTEGEVGGVVITQPPTDVAGVQVERVQGQALPVTGGDVVGLTMIGGALVAVGVVVVAGRRRRLA